MSARGYGPAVLLGVVGGAAAFFTASQPWSRVTVETEGLARDVVSVTGNEALPVVGGLALVALAGMVAVLASRGRVRTAVGVVVTLVFRWQPPSPSSWEVTPSTRHSVASLAESPAYPYRRRCPPGPLRGRRVDHRLALGLPLCPCSSAPSQVRPSCAGAGPGRRWDDATTPSGSSARTHAFRRRPVEGTRPRRGPHRLGWSQSPSTSRLREVLRYDAWFFPAAWIRGRHLSVSDSRSVEWRCCRGRPTGCSSWVGVALTLGSAVVAKVMSAAGMGAKAH